MSDTAFSQEASYMARYAWRTLLALYDRLALRGRLRLRAVDRYVVLPSEVSDSIKLPALMHDLLDAVYRVLRRIQMLLVEEVVVCREGSCGRVVTGLAARYLPLYIPISVRRISIETAANLLVAATILEARERLSKLVSAITSIRASPSMKPLHESVCGKLRDALRTCDYILRDPFIRPLLQAAKTVLGRPSEVEKLEKEVEAEALLKPREYQAYLRVLDLRKMLRGRLVLAERLAERGDFAKSLVLDLKPSKLYELFAFTMVLEALLDRFAEVGRVEVDADGRVIVIHGRLASAGPVTVKVAYNAVPSDVSSRIRAASAHGILDREMDTSRLVGLPDTIILVEGGGLSKKIVVDYKYTREVDYLVQARFKALAYLYEFSADAAVIITPAPAETREADDETIEQGSFYRGAVSSGGALVTLDGTEKLAIAFVNPVPKDEERNRVVIRSLFRQLLPEVYGG